MGFSRQEHWSGQPFSSSRDLPDPGIEPESPALAGGFLSTEPAGESPKIMQNRTGIASFLSALMGKESSFLSVSLWNEAGDSLHHHLSNGLRLLTIDLISSCIWLINM